MDNCPINETGCQMKAAFNERFAGMDRAAVLKAAEIDRRLDELNDLRKEVIIDRMTLVNKESFDPWKAVVNERLTKLMTPYEQKPAKPNWTAIVVVGIGILNLGVLILHYVRG